MMIIPMTRGSNKDHRNNIKLPGLINCHQQN